MIATLFRAQGEVEYGCQPALIAVGPTELPKKATRAAQSASFVSEGYVLARSLWLSCPTGTLEVAVRLLRHWMETGRDFPGGAS